MPCKTWLHFFFSCLVRAIPNIASIVVQEPHDGAADYTSACGYLRQLVGDTYMGGAEMTATSNLTEPKTLPLTRRVEEEL